MRKLASRETLALRWAEVMRDPSLQNLPYKIERNARGKIEMSPASNIHGRFQARLASELNAQLPCSDLNREPFVDWINEADPHPKDSMTLTDSSVPCLAATGSSHRCTS